MSNMKKFMERFAEENGIAKDAVKEFISGSLDCQTLKDVMNLPYELQSHSSWMPDEPLESYIEDWEMQRHEIVKLDRVVESLCDKVSYLINDFSFELEDLTKSEIESLLAEKANEENLEELQKVKAVIFYIIDSRFGSAEIDW